MACESLPASVGQHSLSADLESKRSRTCFRRTQRYWRQIVRTYHQMGQLWGNHALVTMKCEVHKHAERLICRLRDGRMAV